MKKAATIGMGITVIVTVLLFAASSIYEENLIRPPSTSTSQNQAGEEIQITIPPESISSKEKNAPKEEVIQSIEKTTQENDSQANVMAIKVKDGVGSGDR